MVFLAVMAGYAAVILACTARRSPAVPATVAMGTAIGAAIGVVAYALGPLGFPLRFTGSAPTRLYDAAVVLGVLLALCAPVTAGLAATRRAGRALPAGSRARQGAIAGLCTGVAAALVVAVLSTATIALLPYDTGLRSWAPAHIGQWTPIDRPVDADYRPEQLSRLRGGQQRLRGRVPHRAPAQPAVRLRLRRLGRPGLRPPRSCPPAAASRPPVELKPQRA